MDWRQFANFTEAEFACHCGCGRAEMVADFMITLQALRTACGFGFPISSGFRCPDYNAQVSRTGQTGPHTTGRAADVRVFGKRARILISLADYETFPGLGGDQRSRVEHRARFVHLDAIADSDLRPWFWTY